MTSSDSTDPPVLQDFISEDGKPLTSLPAHLCQETRRRYVLWKDIEDTFKGVDYLIKDVDDTLEGLDYLIKGKQRCLFMINQQGELYVFFCYLTS